MEYLRGYVILLLFPDFSFFQNVYQYVPKRKHNEALLWRCAQNLQM